MNRRSRALLVLVAVGAAACEGDRRGAAEAAADLCTTWLAAEVTHQETCRAASASYLERRIAGLPASCALLRRSVLEGRIGFDRASSAACAASLEVTYAGAPCDAPPPAEPERCRAAFRPLVPHGGTCTQPADCLDGWCVFPEGTCPRPGVCVPLGEEYDACDESAPWPARRDSCRAGLDCVWTGEGVSTCRAPPAPVGEGSRCGSGLSCDSGLYCRGSGGGGEPECRPELRLGDPCPDGSGCATGLVCNRYTACARYVGEGASCAEVTAICGSGLFCDDAGGCEAYPVEGEGCSLDRGCLDGFCSSVDSRCHRSGGTGAPCSETEPCDGNTHACVDGVCVPECPGW